MEFQKKSTVNVCNKGPHYLSKEWCFFIHTHSQSENYGSSYKKLLTFDTCEEWGRLINNVPKASTLLSATNEVYINNEKVVAYSVFKKNIHPEWEHGENRFGCEWGCRQIINSYDADLLWENLFMELISGKLDVLGIRVVNKSNFVRSFSKIEIWMSDKDDPADIYMNLQRVFQSIDLLEEAPNFQLLYHDSKQKDAKIFLDKKKRRFKEKRFSNFI